MDDGTLYDTPNGKKTLTEMIAGLQGAQWDGNYSDPAAVIAAYNQTAAGGSSSSGGSGNAAQDLLDAIASGDQQRFDEAVKEFNQNFAENQRQFNTSTYSQLAQNLLSTSAQLRGPEDYYQFNKYTSGGRDLFQQLFGNQPRPDFSEPTGAITPETIGDLMTKLGFTTAPTGTTPPAVTPAATQTPAPAPAPAVNPAAPAGSVPAVGNQNVNGGAHPAVAPPAPTTPLSGVAASVGAAPAPVQQPAPVSTALPLPSATPPAVAQPTQATVWPTGQTATQPVVAGGGSPAQTAATPMPGAVTQGWKNPQQPIPLPYQINPAVWDAMGSVGQALALSAAEAAGWDKNEYLRQINAARPQGTAPGASSTAFRTPMGAFS